MSLLCSTSLGNSPALPTGEAESTYRTQTALAYRKRLFIIIIIIKDHLLALPREALHLSARSQCLTTDKNQHIKTQQKIIPFASLQRD